MSTGYLAFRDLQPGDTFRFMYGWPPRVRQEATVNTKLSQRTYWCGSDARKYSAGAGTAVELVTKESPVGGTEVAL